MINGKKKKKKNEAPEGNQYYEFSITIKYSMKKVRKKNEAPQGIDTTYLDTRVNNETKTKTHRLKKGPFH